MLEGKKGNISIAIIAILAIVILGAAYTVVRFASQKSVQLPTSKTTQSLPVNFSETGVILDWDANREIHTNNWKFLYDKPGALASTVKLELDQNSLCDLESGEKICDKSEFINGTTVTLEGNRSGDNVTVVKMKKIAM